jgi:hypothetical protein
LAAAASSQSLPPASVSPANLARPGEGPPPPVAPDVESRDGQGRATIRAIAITQPLHIDGQLDEELYRTVPSISNFIQLEPTAGAPASERTELWISYDSDAVYVSVRCWDSQPERRWILTEMRRDSNTISTNENVAFWFDTFFDRQNAFEFEVNAIGGIYDSQIINGRFNADWNPVWQRKVGRFDGGWTAEVAIPFKSLRYRPGASQTWGFNMRRTIRWKNEETFLTRVPRRGGANARGSIALVNSGATLVGISAPPGSRNLELKPYALSSLNADRLARPAVNNEVNGDVGFDVKYGVTQNLTADFTYRTDFAQVEVDAQQVNLTRFSLFYPEKRDFFLEGQGIFDFGGAGAAAGTSVTPLLFFSRRIGLNGAATVPIDAGGRLTGRVGRYTVGVLNVLTGDDEASGTARTNFSVIRVKRDILRRSTVGAMFTGRSVSTVNDGSAQTFGIDSTLGFGATMNVDAYLAKTRTPGVHGDDMSSRLHLNYNGGRYGLEVDHLRIGDNFNPDVGFLRRDNLHRSFASGRFSPRLTSVPHVRRFISTASYDYLTDGRGRKETTQGGGGVGLEFENNDTMNVDYFRYYELLKAPFLIDPTVRLPVGGYDFQDVTFTYGFQNTHRLSGNATLSRGTFYNGTKTTTGFSAGRIKVTPRISFEPGTSINWVDLVQGSFTSATVSNRGTFTVTPQMFLTGLVQYNTSTKVVGTNIRFRWEYQPGSEFFVVYTDERDAIDRGVPGLRNRAFVMKANRLFRF